MLRSHTGIEHMLNLINGAHGIANMLPYLDDKFAAHKNFNPQVARHESSNHIHQEIFFDSLANYA